MIKQLVIYLIVLVVLWILNIIITVPLRNRVGDNHEYFKKVVDNGNALFYDLGGLILITISWYVFAPVRWLVLTGYTIYSAWGVFSAISGLVLNILMKFKYKENQFNEFILWVSNLIELCGSFLILYATVHYLFGWI